MENILSQTWLVMDEISSAGYLFYYPQYWIKEWCDSYASQKIY